MEPGQVPDGVSEAEISRLVTEHGTRLLRFACLYLKDLHLAQDAVQEAFFKASRNLQTFQGQSSELTWLTAITLNCCRSIRRSAWFKAFQTSVSADTLDLADEGAGFRDDSLLREVMGLPPKYREIILLYYYQELSLKEIGEMLGKNVSTLSTRLKRARSALRTRLEGWWFDGE